MVDRWPVKAGHALELRLGTPNRKNAPTRQAPGLAGQAHRQLDQKRKALDVTGCGGQVESQ